MSEQQKSVGKVIGAIIALVGLVAAAVYQHTAAVGSIEQLRKDVERVEVRQEKMVDVLEQVREACWTMMARDRVATRGKQQP